MKVKAALCELLSEVHAELGASQFGRHVNHKLRVTDFVKNKQVRRRHGKSDSNRGHFLAMGNEPKGREWTTAATAWSASAAETKASGK